MMSPSTTHMRGIVSPAGRGEVLFPLRDILLKPLVSDEEYSDREQGRQLSASELGPSGC